MTATLSSTVPKRAYVQVNQHVLRVFVSLLVSLGCVVLLAAARQELSTVKAHRFDSPPREGMHDQSAAETVKASLTVSYKSGSKDVLHDGATRMFVANLDSGVKPMVPLTLTRVADCLLSESDSDEQEKEEACVHQAQQSVLDEFVMGAGVDSAFASAKPFSEVM